MVEAPPNMGLGRFVNTPLGGETVRAFVPPPLPPDPPIDVLGLLDRVIIAERSLGLWIAELRSLCSRSG